MQALCEVSFKHGKLLLSKASDSSLDSIVIIHDSKKEVPKLVMWCSRQKSTYKLPAKGMSIKVASQVYRGVYEMVGRRLPAIALDLGPLKKCP